MSPGVRRSAHPAVREAHRPHDNPTGWHPHIPETVTSVTSVTLSIELPPAWKCCGPLAKLLLLPCGEKVAAGRMRGDRYATEDSSARYAPVGRGAMTDSRVAPLARL